MLYLLQNITLAQGKFEEEDFFNYNDHMFMVDSRGSTHRATPIDVTIKETSVKVVGTSNLA